MVGADTLEKKDKSPVTVADFASQAIVCERLAAAFPADPVVAEEDAEDLRADGSATVRTAVVQAVNAEIGREVGAEQVLGWIDRGGAEASGSRYWTLDPIDGTKGFLRREQYAVALALLEDGEVVLGVLGCPNLPFRGDQTGVLLAAVAGEEAVMLPLWDDAETEGESIAVAPVTARAAARFCESVEAGHSDQSESAAIAEILGISAPPLRIDSQCKYAVVARGDASIYLRMPTRADYREKIWDHAAGKIVVEAAGGRVTDIAGNALDFHHGRTLERNRGVVATSGAIHAEVLAAIRRTRG
jgi:3'(2'), 5'-bisphosphate nucleotidase